MTADLLYSEAEEDLRSVVRAALADRCPPEAILARCETDQPYHAALWRVLGRELGVTALLVPESLGGAGAGVREVAVVAEEIGRAVAPVPFLGHSVLATGALLAAGADELLRAVTGDSAAAGDGTAAGGGTGGRGGGASGTVAGAEVAGDRAAGDGVAALAVPLAAYPGMEFPETVRVAGDGALDGSVRSVADAAVADLLVVPAVGPQGPELRAVWPREVQQAAGPGSAVVAPVVSLDLTRPVADVTFSAAPSWPVAAGERAVSALAEALTLGAGVLASEQVGVAQWCLDSTVAYLKQRHQFGRPVGSFQALKHRLAEVWQRLVTARAAARYAADALARRSEDVPVAVAVAQSVADVAVRAAEECVQLHGGIGMTWEHPAHLYLKRAKADQIALGTPGRHRAALATLVDLPGPTPTGTWGGVAPESGARSG